MQDREYLEIPGWPGYRVSNDGRLETCRDHSGCRGDWRPKTLTPDRDGYLRVKLHHFHRIIFIGVHTLVLTCFGTAKPPGKSMCLHRDGDPSNNNISNLCWGFGIDNAVDRERHGRTAAAEKNGRAKLTWEQVESIRSERSATGTSLQELADKYAVSKKTVLNIVHKKTWVRRQIPRTPENGSQATTGCESDPLESARS